MLIQAFLSTLEYDPDGYLELELDDQSTGLQDFSRRAAIVPTLDGGAWLDSMGVFDAARVLTVIARVSDEVASLLATFCRVYERLHLAMADGLFLVVPMSFGRSPGLVAMQLTILARVS